MSGISIAWPNDLFCEVLDLEKEYQVKARMVHHPEKQGPFKWRRKEIRSGRLFFTNDGIQFEEWNIPYSKIKKAIIYTPEESFIGPTNILRIYSDFKTYEFSAFRLKFPDFQFLFPIQKKTVPMLTKTQNLWSYAFIIVMTLIFIIYKWMVK